MPDKSITTKLLATTAVADLVRRRIRPGKLDEADVEPGIIVERSMKLPVNTAGGTTTTKFAHVLVGCSAETYAAAIGLADIVEDTLNGYSGGDSPTISMIHVQDGTYDPGPVKRGKDELWERFVLDCLVQYVE